MGEWKGRNSYMHNKTPDKLQQEYMWKILPAVLPSNMPKMYLGM